MSSATGPGLRPVPLAIIGIGCMFPKAESAQAYWLNIKNGVDGIGPIPPSHWNPDDYFDADPKSPDRTYAARGGFLEPVDFRPLDFGIAPNDLEATDTSQLLGLVAARNALRDAGYDGRRPFDRGRVSVIIGVTGTLELVIPLGARLGHPRWRKALANAGVPQQQARQIIEEIGASYVGWQENSFPGLLGNVVAGRIANRLDLGGTNCVVDAACASSLSAIHLAGLELSAGRCDIAVSGGIDTFNDIFMFMCFSKTPALSPSGDARPFDAKSDGTILGEGLGIVVLKRLADAERDGDRVYAVIKGLGSSSDGKGNAIYAPSAAGQVKALRNAYELAGITPNTVELVEAHGTGTRVGDSVEAAALTEVYRGAAAAQPAARSSPAEAWCALGSVKSQIGHTKAAAGAAGLIKAALALHHKVLPPTIKVDDPADAVKPGQSPFYINTQKRPWIGRAEHPRRAAVSAFGFGGSNFHCVLEEHAGPDARVDWDGDVEIIALSAAGAEELSTKLDGWRRPRNWSEIQRDAATSRAAFSTTHDRRLLLVAQRGSADLPRLVETALGKCRAEPAARFWRLPDGAYFGRGRPPGGLAVMFPGQGSQYPGMLRDLACSFPSMRRVLGDADRVFARMMSGDPGRQLPIRRGTGPAEHGGSANPAIAAESKAEHLGRLSDAIYPHAAFTKAQRDEQESQLRRTEVAQPAIGAASLGALKVLEGFGLQPDAYAGHSYGELPALCAAGCFDEESLHTMSRLRGHLMAAYRGDDAGGMLAVHAPLRTIESIVRENALELVIANRNAPAQSVLSGRCDEIDRAAACLDRQKVRHTRLPVAAAFHSPLVAAAKKPFGEALAGVEVRAPDRPVFANSSGTRYPQEPDSIRELLGGQLACPVEFVREITGMADSGIRTFLEVGPGSTLTRLVGAILGGPEAPVWSDWDAFAIDSSNGKRPGALDLAHALARLASRGHTLELSSWQHRDDRAIDEAPRPGLVVPICGANYVSPKVGQNREINQSAPVAGRDTMNRLTPNNEKPTAAAPPPARNERERSPDPKQLANDDQLVPAQQIVGEGAAPRRGDLSPTAVAQAFQVTQQSLAAFQLLQEQTAGLHRQFLEHQLSAQRTLQLLVEQQHAMLLGGAVAPLAPAAPSRHAPPERAAAPVVEAPPAAMSRNGDLRPLAAPSPAAPPPVVQTGPAPDMRAILLGVVAEKTGYPADMLTPEMALDADLGIDSIKRVEIFSALQERLPDAPPVKPEHLGSLQTLSDVIVFLTNEQPSISAAGSPVSEQSEATSRTADVDSVLFAVVAEKTGYPVEMLNSQMALDADLGIDSIKRVEIFSALQERLPNAPIIKPEQLGTLHSLGAVAQFLSGQNGTPDEPEKKKHTNAVAVNSKHERALIDRSVLRAVRLPPVPVAPIVKLPAGSWVVLVGDECPAVPALIQAVETAGCRVRNISWSHASDPIEEGAAALLLVAPAVDAPDDLPLRAFRWLRQLGPSLRRAAEHGGALLATITQMDGAFGLGNLDAAAAVHVGALAGLAKTASHEWPNVVCRAVDLDPALPNDQLAELWNRLVSRGPGEMGISSHEMVTLELTREPVADQSSFSISSDEVILISGGARGVTAAVAQRIAEQFRPTLVLIGRTDLDVAEPDWLRDCLTEADIKKALVRHLSPSPTPKMVETEYRAVAARREALANIERMTNTGARIVYRSADVADTASIERALIGIRQSIGPVTHLIHGAGALADRRIDDLTDEQFQRVYDTKVRGIEALLRYLDPASLKSIILFSSSTGRFGRSGQAAYAAANEALNKIAQRQARRWPACKVAALNWGPWDGGMVTPALRSVFASEGVGTIPLRLGAELLLDEMRANRSAVEVAIIARAAVPKLPDAAESLPVVLEPSISLADYPILRSHIIDGRPVLPLALHVELLAHAALHGNPGLHFHGLEELRLFHGVILEGDAPARLTLRAGKAVKEGSGFFVPVELAGQHGQRDRLHSRARVLLVPRLPEPDQSAAWPHLPAYELPVADAYRRQLFHGPDLQGIERVEGLDSSGIAGLVRTGPAPAKWLRQPLRSAWIADPLVLDGAFQLLILWSFAQHGSGCLPSFVGRYRQYCRRFPVETVRIQIRIKRTTAAQVKADIGFVGADGQLLAEMLDHESTIDTSLNQSFRRNQLSPEVS